MLNLFNLIKINFTGFFKFVKFSSFLSFLKFLLFVSLYFVLGIFIYHFASFMVRGFSALNLASLAISEFFAFSSMFILALSIFRIDIFNSKDHDLLTSLPLSKKVIVASKLINVYVFNLLVIIIIMVPVYIAFLNATSFSLSFLLRAFLATLIIPIIPTAIAVLINSIVTFISTRFKYKKIIQTILMSALMLFSLYFAYSMNNNLELNLLDIQSSFNEFFNNFYPLTKYFTNMIIDNDFKSTIVFLGLSILAVIILILFLSAFYNKVTNKIIVRSKHSSKVKLSNRSSFTNLIKKDIKRVIYSPNYLLNSCFGLIIIIFVPILLLFVSIDSLKNIPITEDILINYLPLIYVFLILLSSTTSSLISIEGKNFYILKMLPLKFSTIWASKVLSNFLLIIASSLVSLILFNISLNLSLKINIEAVLLIFASGLFISLYGLVINLLFPTFSWKSEIKVIKQSAASFITIFTGLIMGLYIFSNDYVSNNFYIYLLIVIFGVLSLILILFLQIVGPKIYAKLQI